jgi:formate hydrogenlyase transcriptional activator
MMYEVARVAVTDATVLVLGETGSGKDLVAREIHRRSARRNRPFVSMNCGALPSGLVESEIFGHEKGAFTGASQRRLGRFELAHTGTLFMDEVGELPLETQVKFLHLLQRGEFERVGGNQTHKVDVRIVAATNRNLEKLVNQGGFRADLFYRLNIFPVYVPPLRERVADIIPLVNHFVQKFCVQFGRNIKALNRESLRRLQGYAWPGNIRELEHVIERAVLLADDEVLTVDLSCPRAQSVSREAFHGSSTDLVPLDELERTYLQRVLEGTGGLIEGSGGAAEILKLKASTLRSRLKKLGVPYGNRRRITTSP